MIPAFTTLICYLCVIYGDKELSQSINGIIAPMVTVFILAYFISCKFNELFGMTIETILLCFIADEELFSPEKRYAEADLQDVIYRTSSAAEGENVHHDAGREVELYSPVETNKK